MEQRALKELPAQKPSGFPDLSMVERPHAIAWWKKWNV